MSYRFGEHTADIRLEITAESFQEIFIEAVRAMNAVMKPAVSDGTVEREVTIEASDRLSLLVDFLNELLSLAGLHHEAYETLEIGNIGETHVDAFVKGRKTRGMEAEIKAVTWHEASLFETGDGTWRATLVLDI